ncbi:hypothetical protein NL676_033841 [Syzygium grande]|nr:hypothetical protein NL676_033841 [Syzygium grande]
MKGCEDDKVDQSKAVIANGPSKACNAYECLLQPHSNLSLCVQSLKSYFSLHAKIAFLKGKTTPLFVCFFFILWCLRSGGGVNFSQASGGHASSTSFFCSWVMEIATLQANWRFVMGNEL